MKEHTSGLLGEKITRMWESEAARISAESSDSKKNDSKDKTESGRPAGPSLLRILTKCFGARVMIYGIALAVMEIALR